MRPCLMIVAMLYSSHINFLFRPPVVITTREEKIKCSVGDELGDATYSRGETMKIFMEGADEFSWLFRTPN